MEKPKISVIMTTYQRPKKLKRAVKSVQKQTFKDWELIIYDDYSQDETEKVCKILAKKDERITYIRGTFNSGTHAFGKNKAFAEAKADLIAYLDDDNVYRKDHLQALYKYIGKADIIYGDRWVINETGHSFGRTKFKGISSDPNPQQLAQANYIDTSDVLIRKEALEYVGGWDESLPKFADWNLFVRLTKAGFKFKHLPLILTDYYLYSDSNQLKHPGQRNPRTGAPMPTFDPYNCTIWADETSLGKPRKLKVAIFTLTMDRLEYTKRTFNSMEENAGYDYDLFVIDNGSQEDTIKYLQSLKKKDKIKYLQLNKENVGISKGSNQALDAIGKGYDIVIKVDNDCAFITKDWLKNVVKVYGITQNQILSPRVEGLMDSPGGVPRMTYHYLGEEFVGVTPHIGGLCSIAPAKLYDDFRWEENDFLHGTQDLIFSKFAQSQGYLIGYLENIIVEHMDGTDGQQEKFKEYFEKRKEQKTKKYEEPKH